MLPLKKNAKQTWKLHQVNKIYSAHLIPRNTLMVMEKEETVYVFLSNDLAKSIYRLPSKSAPRKEEVGSGDFQKNSNSIQSF